MGGRGRVSKDAFVLSLLTACFAWPFFLPFHCSGAITSIESECELEALNIGTRLVDRFNEFDEETEWDMRIHHDFIAEHLGFAGWIQSGLWKSDSLSAHRGDCRTQQRKGGWAGSNNISSSSYWAFNNKWLYMMGDSTQRQVWASFVSGFQSNTFEANAKEWTRENCGRQEPHRKVHVSGGHFPEEGWGGKCGNNELTCHLQGFGGNGKMTFDWKHFPWEDYDEWLFGPEGRWRTDEKNVERYPDILIVQVGLHTCVHAFNPGPANHSMVAQHEKDIPILMKAVRAAVDGVPAHRERTRVVFQTAGRAGNSQPENDRCSWHLNRVIASEAHKAGFVVLEREELERRMLFKSEYHERFKFIKPQLHIENPMANIVGTALLSLVSCLERNGSDYNRDLPPVRDE